MLMDEYTIDNRVTDILLAHLWAFSSGELKNFFNLFQSVTTQAVVTIFYQILPYNG